MKKPVTILWLRRDLRLGDHPALHTAAARGPVVPIYIHEEKGQGDQTMGAAQRWWCHQALKALSNDLKIKGIDLLIRQGSPQHILPALMQETGADELVFSRLYDPPARVQEQAVTEAIENSDQSVRSFNASVLHEPWEVQTKTGQPYKVYTPFAKACWARSVARPLSVPRTLTGIKGLKGCTLDSLALCPRKPNWATRFDALWPSGEAAALKRLDAFLKEPLASYHDDRNRPDKDGVSRLSPYLALGMISPRQIWHKVFHKAPALTKGAESFLKEILWREFSYHLLYHLPHMAQAPIQTSFEKFLWRTAPKELAAWQQGQTGFPIVDAGMRQLWQEGWMHGRVRMIVASFLVKDCLLPWQEGEAWFWDTLLDADLANNAASWQWVAGCGADAAPYFRIFNPVLQGKKFDPQGDYVRRYVPELSAIAGPTIHAPWLMDAATLAEKGVVLGKNYPKPLLDHAKARIRALTALKASKET